MKEERLRMEGIEVEVPTLANVSVTRPPILRSIWVCI